VVLGNITAIREGSANHISWNTLTETPDMTYNLERSTDGRSYSSLATLKGKGTGAAYNYMDAKPEAGVNYYRLKIIEVNGTFTYSRTVSVSANGANGFTVTAAPNPVRNMLTVQVSGASENTVLSLMSTTGNLLRTAVVTGGQAAFDMSALPAGMYMIRYSNDAQNGAIRITKQ
jgi:hypothetical protein